MKFIYVLLDGVGDLPDKNLNWTTPLESACTPNLDRLTRNGTMGLVHPVGKGIAPESDIAVFSMLGYEFRDGYAGRGVVEAIGAGLEFEEGNLALRANFATVDERGLILDRRSGRDLSDSEARELAQAVNEELVFGYPDVLFQFAHTVGHRASLVMRHSKTKLSGNITNTDPAYSRLGGIGVARGRIRRAKIEECRPLDGRPESKLSAQLVNEFSKKVREILQLHPVNRIRTKSGKIPGNAVLLRDAGAQRPQLRPLKEQFGATFACLVEMPVEVGISKLTGMARIAAGERQDYELKAQKAFESLSQHDVVYVHLKGPDEPGHDGLPKLKKRVIEEIDARFFSKLVASLDLDMTGVVVSADHSTPCRLKRHSADPVPLLVSGGKSPHGGCCRFTERYAAKGVLGILRGVDVLPRVFSLLE